MMGGIFSNKQRIRDKAMKGIVPVRGAVRNEKRLGKGGANQNIIHKCEGKRRRDIRRR